MMKKIGIGFFSIAAAIVIVSAMAMASNRPEMNNFKTDVGVVIKGILSPRQMSMLMDFHQEHGAKRRAHMAGRPHPLELWSDLDLSQEQQEALRDIIDAKVDEVHPYLIAVFRTGSKIRQAIFEEGAGSLEALSHEAGTNIGEAAWNVALAFDEAKSILTKGQIDRLNQLRDRRIAHFTDAAEAMDGVADDVAALWEDLDLSPNQVDALGVVHKHLVGRRHDHRLAKHEELREKIWSVLDSEQSAVADDFYNERKAECMIRFSEMIDAHERFREELSLTGEQKIQLLDILIDRRDQITTAVKAAITAAMDLGEAMHASSLDKRAVMAAARKLGDGIFQVAQISAQCVADADHVLTDAQMALVKKQFDQHSARRLEWADAMPERIHEGIDFLKTLNLTGKQKHQIVQFLMEMHQSRNGRRI